ncbi:hypothetical protein L228DRAFT_118391 [Xylona heveae TC161]|uniref:Uncharacterized protein n=1 Tax=Xylona heveae (strain CBS 132557 / TC161) TaxID=1328760 RepID=A0A165HHT6_XYLHT|nr:hypothetical protein L228DRAFT_118391 [Xylona heveae TC161]KZF23539.1 hypothetical protein L228DRAFT_118391 [Xylona heveae TC161]
MSASILTRPRAPALAYTKSSIPPAAANLPEPANPEELIASPIRAEIELSYSDPALRGLVDIEGLPKALTISVPPTVPVSKDGCAFDPSAAASRPPFCISVNVDLLVAPDATFSDFAIVSSFLDQIFLPGLNLNVSNSTFFSSISGSILVPPASSSSSHSSSMAPCHSSSSSSSSGIAARTDDDSTTLFDSRRTIITTTSGSIEGAFKLLDLLSLQTHSGSIKVDVSPQDAAPAPELPKPAAFSASSLSGSVEVRYPIRALGSEVPARNYTVHAESISGSVSGTFFHGEYTSLKSKSGHVEASLLPVIVTEGKKSFLRTQTVSGSTEIDIHDPLYLLPDSDTTTNDVSDVSDDDDKGKFNGEHATVSGSLKLRYPGEWEGTITGSSTSGSLDVRGKGVEVQKKTDLPWSHQLVAKKGDGNSHIGFHTTSGSVDLLVGEEV